MSWAESSWTERDWKVAGSNGNATASAGSGKIDPWSEKDPWGGARSAKASAWEDSPQKVATPEKKGVSDIRSGTYTNDWSAKQTFAIDFMGDIFTIVDKSGEWGATKGSVKDDRIEVQDWKLKGSLTNGIITWDGNNATWTCAPRQQDSRSSTAEQENHWDTSARGSSSAADVGGSSSAQIFSAEQGGGATSSDQTWAASRNQPAAAAASEDPQRAARWKEFSACQVWNKENNILPGKSDNEVQEDEQRLFLDNIQSVGIDFALYDEVPCNVTGSKSENIPLLTTFQSLYEIFKEYIPETLMQNIQSCGYTLPTPVQKYALPAAISQRDVMCCAQTGSGKTAAFLIPVLASLMRNNRGIGLLTSPFEGTCRPDTLILSPTRELCLQIYDEALKFCHRTGFRCIRVYGQESVKTQIQEVARGADVCVATPGRLWDFVTSGIMELVDVNCLVFDEADRMLQTGMESTLRELVEGSGMPGSQERQTMMFSATFPDVVQKVASDYLYDYVFVAVGVVGGATNMVAQEFEQVSPDEKYERLIDILHQWLDERATGERLLVFTNSKQQAKGLDERLYESNFDTGALHGDLDQRQREENLAKFRKGQIDIMVATDVAARGLDITGVSRVINFDLPWEPETYVQRIGRTGRIGHRGHATTFITVDKDGKWWDRVDTLSKLPDIISDANGSVPTWLSHKIEEIRLEAYAYSTEAHRTDYRQRNDQPAWEPWSAAVPAEVDGAMAEAPWS